MYFFFSETNIDCECSDIDTIKTLISFVYVVLFFHFAQEPFMLQIILYHSHTVYFLQNSFAKFGHLTRFS